MRQRIIRQHDERDCGAACLAMIAQHYGLRLPISRFRELTKSDQRGANLYGLVDGARMLGLEGVAMKGDIVELSDALSSEHVATPFVAHIRENGMLHYVVVRRFDGMKFHIADPARGVRVLTVQEFSPLSTGFWAFFRKTADFQEGNHVKNNLVRFLFLLRGLEGRLAFTLLLSFIIAIIGVLGAFAFEVIIDGFGPDQGASSSHGGQPSVAEGLTDLVGGLTALADVQPLTVIFSALVGLYVLQAVIQFLRGYLIVTIARQIDVQLLSKYFDHILDLPSSSAALRKTGEYLSRFSDATAIRAAISGVAVSLVLDASMLMGTAVILYLQSPPLFWASLTVIVLYVIVVLCYRRPLERNNRLVMEHNANLQSFLKESVDGLPTVKAAAAEEGVKASTRKNLRFYVNSVVRASMVEISQETIAEAVQSVGTALILWLGFSMVMEDSMGVGSLITFYALLTFFVQPVRNLVDLQPAVQKALVAADRLNDVLDLKKEQATGGAPLGSASRWELRDVHFRYGNRARALRGASLTVRRGEKIALVGESGSGKTTVARMFLRFHEPESGELFVDGRPLKGVNLAELRQGTAYVDQETFLFADTINNNLRLGVEGISDAEVQAACEAVRADAFIADLPLGIETPLDENGLNLSGGQRQRLAIARALLRKPQLLILDEATSNLDAVTEAAVREVAFKTSGDRACIFIAHRLATIVDCDRIYVLSDGEVVESGAHDELLSNDGLYRRMWEKQAASPVEVGV